MGTSSVALIWYLLCLGFFLFVVAIAGTLIVMGRRSEVRARARLRARHGVEAPKGEGSEPSDPPSGGGAPPA
jgi:hypothetical protein